MTKPMRYKTADSTQAASRRKTGGFTFIELTVTIAIILLLTAIGYKTSQILFGKSDQKNALDTLYSLRTEVKQSALASGGYGTNTLLNTGLIAANVVPGWLKVVNATAGTLTTPAGGAVVVTGAGTQFTISMVLPRDLCIKVVQNTDASWVSVGSAGKAETPPVADATTVCTADGDAIIWTSN